MRFAVVADLHFGGEREHPGHLALQRQLENALRVAAPQVLLVAGDLTTRARRGEFAAAERWLQALGVPTLVIPGNHDLPCWNLLRRLARPMSRFKGLFAWPDNAVLQRDRALFVGGDSTARWQPHLRWQDGRFARRELQRVCACFEHAGRRVSGGGGCLKVFVSHHPLVAVPPAAAARRPGVVAARAGRMLDILRAHEVELLVSGHEHVSNLQTVERGGWRVLAMSVPTALSHRLRGEANGFWTVDVSERTLALRLWRHQPEGRFAPGPVVAHPRRRPIS